MIPKRPHALAFLAQKGGSGKTTLAVHIAVAAQADGERVLILDTDPQGSAATWATSRKGELPKVLKVSPSRVTAVLEAAREEGITLVVIDTAPHASPDAAQAIERVDYILIPCRPTSLDLATMGTSIALARASRHGFAIVLNACPARAPEVPEAHALVKERHELSPLSMVIGDRRTLARALATGRAATEFAPKSPAATEVRALWQHVKEIFA
jgi:chromosome partitioning protein